MSSSDARWFHLTTHTYGSWLHRDPRGFRTRHRREHIEGDYKNPPPPGKHNARFARSKKLLKHPPEVLSKEWRRVVGEAFRDRLITLAAEVLCVSMSATHAHAQAKVPDDQARAWVGFAKKHAWFTARDQGWKNRRWAKRGRALPIRDRAYQIHVFHDIEDHRSEGAWVWTFRDPLPPQRPPVTTGGL